MRGAGWRLGAANPCRAPLWKASPAARRTLLMLYYQMCGAAASSSRQQNWQQWLPATAPLAAEAVGGCSPFMVLPWGPAAQGHTPATVRQNPATPSGPCAARQAAQASPAEPGSRLTPRLAVGCVFHLYLKVSQVEGVLLDFLGRRLGQPPPVNLPELVHAFWLDADRLGLDGLRVAAGWRQAGGTRERQRRRPLAAAEREGPRLLALPACPPPA